MMTLMWMLGVTIAQAGDQTRCELAMVNDTIEEWSAYLAKHPRGKCHVAARARIEALKLDEEACEQARRSDTLDAWNIYVRRFPTGLCAVQAQTKLTVATANGEWVPPSQRQQPVRVRPGVQPMGLALGSKILDLQVEPGDAQAVEAAQQALDKHALSLLTCFRQHPDVTEYDVRVHMDGDRVRANAQSAVAGAADDQPADASACIASTLGSRIAPERVGERVLTFRVAFGSAMVAPQQ